jgi:hypothetical protein
MYALRKLMRGMLKRGMQKDALQNILAVRSYNLTSQYGRSD